ncbi:MAG: sigma 54-interacting transcriptional regulator [Desulfobacterales bacterium]|jgi:transcriptional regulator with PAS, ATPase and Fis domain
MPSALSKYADFKGLALFVFDTNLTLSDQNEAAAALTDHLKLPAGEKRLTELFPELVGSEDALRAILAGRDEGLHLTFISRPDCRGELFTYDLTAMKAGRNQGVLTVEDVGDKARMLQEMNQQKYELLLLKHSQLFRSRYVQESLLGDSPAIVDARRAITKIGQAPQTTVLLTGESGVGKSLAARIIHYSTFSADAPFVDINCSALPENLIEAELFGYAKGAFTHATTARPGLIEEARGGTLFLDEIGELPLSLQAKLLKVIETKTFRRLGSNTNISVRTRIISASNRDLAQEAAAGRFRRDLYYRLNVAALGLPPLREMGADVLLIADHLLKLFSIEFKRQIEGFTPAARKKLQRYHWPGNVRELSNCIERAMIFLDHPRVDAADLSLQDETAAAPENVWKVPPSGIDLPEVERRLILSALETAGQNKTRAARLLGISRDTLRYRLEKLAVTSNQDA